MYRVNIEQGQFQHIKGMQCKVIYQTRELCLIAENLIEIQRIKTIGQILIYGKNLPLYYEIHTLSLSLKKSVKSQNLSRYTVYTSK